jgi:hypothetical protein
VLRETVAALPEAQRAVITLRDIVGCSAEETCNALGVSDTNQRVLLQRAHARVRGVRSRVRRDGPTDMTEMACNELVAVITEYLEGALPAADRRRFEAHLDDCPFWTTYVEQMRATVGCLSDLADDTLSPDARADVLEAFRGWRDQ